VKILEMLASIPADVCNLDNTLRTLPIDISIMIVLVKKNAIGAIFRTQSPTIGTERWMRATETVSLAESR